MAFACVVDLEAGRSGGVEEGAEAGDEGEDGVDVVALVGEVAVW